MNRATMSAQYDVQRRFEKIFKADAEDETNDDEHGDDGDADRIVSQIADLISEAGSADGPVDRQTALRWLLHSRDGQALIARMAQHRKRQTNKQRMTPMQDNPKAAIVLSKAFVEAGRSFLTEHELVKKIEAYALRQRRDGETPEQAFARVYTANDDTGRLFQKAAQIARQAGATPLRIMPDSTEADQDDSAKATAQMERLVDQQIRRAPDMTRSQAWNAVVHDNPMLAATAIRRPAPTTHYPYPRDERGTR